MMGLRKALEDFYAGACEEGKEIAVERGDPWASWEECDRADWMLWLLRRQCSVKDVPDPARAIVRLFFEFTEEAYDALLEPQRTEIMEEYANKLRAMMPNPFTQEGYDWLRTPTLAKHHRRYSAPSVPRPPRDPNAPGFWKTLWRLITFKKL